MSTFLKDPEADLDWVFDWTAWLEAGETIDTFTVDSSTGITDHDASEAAGKVTVWLSGGTAGENYTVSCHIETSAARTDERSMTVRVRER